MSKIVLCGLVLLSASLVCVDALAADPPRVLVVHSYHETQAGHVDLMSAGIEDALSDSGAEIEYFYMDTKRRTSREWKVQAGKLALQKAIEYAPDVVITMDDNAQKFFAVEYASLADSAPIVFSGVNKEPKDYGFPSEKVTGVLERPNLVESIELLQKICPDVKKVVLIADKSPTTEGFYRYAKTIKTPVEILAYEHAENFDHFKEIVRKYEGKADAFGFYVMRVVRVSSDSEERVKDKQLVDWVRENSSLPTFGLFDTSAKVGLMCGISVSMTEQGFAAGKIAAQILDGKKPTSFKVEPTKRGRIMLNLKTAEELGIQVRYSIIKNAKEVIR